MKATIGVTSTILVLSVVTWGAFYVAMSPPLNAAETTVVVGLSALFVLSVRWLARTLRHVRQR